MYPQFAQANPRIAEPIVSTCIKYSVYILTYILHRIYTLAGVFKQVKEIIAAYTVTN